MVLQGQEVRHQPARVRRLRPSDPGGLHQHHRADGGGVQDDQRHVHTGGVLQPRPRQHHHHGRPQGTARYVQRM